MLRDENKERCTSEISGSFAVTSKDNAEVAEQIKRISQELIEKNLAAYTALGNL